MYVLLVDDDAWLRGAVRSLLVSQGCRVSVASNGREAIDFLLAGDRPDIILLDLSMPVLDGVGFLRERAPWPELRQIPVVLMTGEAKVPALGVPVLPKPARPDDIMAALVRHSRALDEEIRTAQVDQA